MLARFYYKAPLHIFLLDLFSEKVYEHHTVIRCFEVKNNNRMIFLHNY